MSKLIKFLFGASSEVYVDKSYMLKVAQIKEKHEKARKGYGRAVLGFE